MGTDPQNDPKFKVVGLGWKLVLVGKIDQRFQKSCSLRPKTMTSSARNRLATVTKDEKNGFPTSNCTEILRVRQDRYADYENISPET